MGGRPGIRTTTTGRIVYNRVFHAFRVTDAIRIVTKLPPPETIQGFIDWVRLVSLTYRTFLLALLPNLYAISAGTILTLVKQIAPPLLRAYADSLAAENTQKTWVYELASYIEAL